MNTTTTKTATTATKTETKNPNQVVEEINLVLPYIGDTIFTNVLDALNTHDTEKEFDDRFMQQHERNVKAVQGENEEKPKVGPVTNHGTSSSDALNTLALMTLMSQPLAPNSFMAKLMEPPKPVPLMDQQPAQTSQAAQANTNGQPPMLRRGGEHLASMEAIPAVEPSFVGTVPQAQRITDITATIEDPRGETDHGYAAMRRHDAQIMQSANRMAQLFSLDAAAREPNTVARETAGQSAIHSVKTDADQTLDRELRNEQFKNISFENQIRKPKDELLLKFLKSWDSGEVKFGGKGDEDEEKKKDGVSVTDMLMFSGALAGLNHLIFGKFGDELSVLEGKAFSRLSHFGDTKWKANQAAKTAQKARIRANTADAKFTNYKGTDLNKSEKLLDNAIKSANDAAKAERAAVEATANSAKATSKIMSKLAGPVRALGKLGKVMGPAGVAITAGAGAMESYERYQAGDVRGAKNSAIGAGTDTALAAASIFSPHVLAGDLAFTGTTWVGKKLGLIDEGSPSSIGEAVTGYLDYRDNLSDQRENTEKMLDSSIRKRLESRAKIAAKQRPDLGDSNMVLDKFLSTDRAKGSIEQIKEASDNYVDANSVGGQFKSLLWGDSSEEAYKKLEAAQDATLSLFDEFASTYDPNKMHDWVFETQARIQAEAENAEIESAKASTEGSAGTVEGASEELERDHEYANPFDPGAMQTSIYNGMFATLMDPRYHEMMRADMAIIGQQLNTRLTG